MSVNVKIERLTAEAFAPFGDVIEAEGEPSFMINDDTTGRFHALAKIDTLLEGGSPAISIFRAQRTEWPVRLTLMERHPLGSQAFMPLGGASWLAVVANTPDAPRSEDIRIFHASGSQGVQYARNIWHHPLVILVASQDFLVVDRCVFGDGNKDNLEEASIEEGGITITANMLNEWS